MMNHETINDNPYDWKPLIMYGLLMFFFSPRGIFARRQAVWSVVWMITHKRSSSTLHIIPRVLLKKLTEYDCKNLPLKSAPRRHPSIHPSVRHPSEPFSVDRCCIQAIVMFSSSTRGHSRVSARARAAIQEVQVDIRASRWRSHFYWIEIYRDVKSIGELINSPASNGTYRVNDLH